MVVSTYLCVRVTCTIIPMLFENYRGSGLLRNEKNLHQAVNATTAIVHSRASALRLINAAFPAPIAEVDTIRTIDKSPSDFPISLVLLNFASQSDHTPDKKLRISVTRREKKGVEERLTDDRVLRHTHNPKKKKKIQTSWQQASRALSRKE